MSVDSNRELPDCKGLTNAIGEIYAAVENPARWSDVLDRLAGMVDGDNIWLVANYTNSIAEDVRAFARADPAALKEYREHYDSVNVWTERCDKMFPAGTVGYTHWAISDRELQRTEFYDGWLKPNDVAYGIGVIMALPDQPPAFLSSLRSHKRGPFEAREGWVFKAILPHLQRALRLHFELAVLRSAKQGLELALDAFDRAAIGLSGKGKILFCNQTARHLLAAADGLCARENCLIAERPEQDTELQVLLKQAAVAGTGFPSVGAILINRRLGRPALRLSLMPFASNLLNHIPELATLVFVDDPAMRPMSRATILRKLFRLSPVETRLTDLLAGGVELIVAAEQLGMSAQTARFHLKSIFRKTGSNRQVDLVRMVVSLPSYIAPTSVMGTTGVAR